MLKAMVWTLKKCKQGKKHVKKRGKKHDKHN